MLDLACPAIPTSPATTAASNHSHSADEPAGTGALTEQGARRPSHETCADHSREPSQPQHHTARHLPIAPGIHLADDVGNLFTGRSGRTVRRTPNAPSTEASPSATTPGSSIGRYGCRTASGAEWTAIPGGWRLKASTACFERTNPITIARRRRLGWRTPWPESAGCSLGARGFEPTRTSYRSSLLVSTCH